jgi:nitrite reductase (NADH) large subunit
MSTKLKLLGVDVASFGDAQGARRAARATSGRRSAADLQKIVVSQTAKPARRRAGGDASDYATLLQMMLNGMALPKAPESLILPALEGSAPKALGVAALPDSAQICSCHNVSKGDICQAVSAARAIWRR